jgi:hypothetical protein
LPDRSDPGYTHEYALLASSIAEGETPVKRSLCSVLALTVLAAFPAAAADIARYILPPGNFGGFRHVGLMGARLATFRFDEGGRFLRRAEVYVGTENLRALARKQDRRSAAHARARAGD